MLTTAASVNLVSVNWSVAGRSLEFSSGGMIMGIVNVTPDSFSDGGKHFCAGDAIDAGLKQEHEGAAILDIGGESTRPGAQAVSTAEELSRVLPVIKGLAAQKKRETILSIDTTKAAVAREALRAGVEIVNDVSGLRFDPEMMEVCAGSNCGVVVMHMRGNPRTMQKQPHYENVVEEVRSFFLNRQEACREAGIAPDRICFDPGIGFGKSLDHNLDLLRRIADLRVGSRPILIGLSKKSFIGKILDNPAMSLRSFPTMALTAWCRESGVEIHRVHDVKENYESMRMMEAILKTC